MPERGEMEVRVQDRDGAVIVSPQGEIAYEEAPVFRSHLKRVHDRKPGKLIVDLSAVGYMNTPGLATLVESLQISNRNRTKFLLCGLNDKVRAIFEIARLHTVFKIVQTVDQALTA